MADRKYREPTSIGGALTRKRALETDIMNIERQLGEPIRYDKDGKEMSKTDYRLWRTSAHSSLVYKKGEHAFLKDWITERRRKVNADEVGIFKNDDPRELLVKARLAMKKALAGDDSDMGAVFNVIDQFLQHAA